MEVTGAAPMRSLPVERVLDGTSVRGVHRRRLTTVGTVGRLVVGTTHVCLVSTDREREMEMEMRRKRGKKYLHQGMVYIHNAVEEDKKMKEVHICSLRLDVLMKEISYLGR